MNSTERRNRYKHNEQTLQGQVVDGIKRAFRGVLKATKHPSDDSSGIDAFRRGAANTEEFLQYYRDVSKNIYDSEEVQAMLAQLNRMILEASERTTVEIPLRQLRELRDELLQKLEQASAHPLNPDDERGLAAMRTAGKETREFIQQSIPAEIAEKNLLAMIRKSHPYSLQKIEQYLETGNDILSATELAFALALDYFRQVQAGKKLLPNLNQATSIAILSLIKATDIYNAMPTKQKAAIATVAAGVTVGCQAVDQIVETPPAAEVIETEQPAGEIAPTEEATAANTPTPITQEPTSTTTPESTATLTPEQELDLLPQKLVEEGIISPEATYDKQFSADGTTPFLRMLEDSDDYGRAGYLISFGVNGENLFLTIEGAQQANPNVVSLGMTERGRGVGFDSEGRVVATSGAVSFNEELGVYTSDWENVMEATTEPTAFPSATPAPSETPAPTATATPEATNTPTATPEIQEVAQPMEIFEVPTELEKLSIHVINNPENPVWGDGPGQVPVPTEFYTDPEQFKELREQVFNKAVELLIHEKDHHFVGAPRPARPQLEKTLAAMEADDWSWVPGFGYDLRTGERIYDLGNNEVHYKVNRDTQFYFLLHVETEDKPYQQRLELNVGNTLAELNPDWQGITTLPLHYETGRNATGDQPVGLHNTFYDEATNSVVFILSYPPAVGNLGATKDVIRSNNFSEYNIIMRTLSDLLKPYGERFLTMHEFTPPSPYGTVSQDFNVLLREIILNDIEVINNPEYPEVQIGIDHTGKQLGFNYGLQ